MPVAISASGGMECRTSSPAAARPSTPLASSARRDVRCHRDGHRPVQERSKSTASTRGSVLAECRAHHGPAQESAAPRGAVRFLQAGLGSHGSLPAAVPRSCSTGPRGAGRSDTRRDRLTCACRSAGDGSGPRFRDLQRSQGGLPQVLPGIDARTGYRTCAQAPAEPARRPVLAYPSRSEEGDLIAPASRDHSRACVLVAAPNLSRRRGRRGKPCNQCGFMAIPMSWASRCGERRWSGRRNRTCVTSFRAPAFWVDE